MESWDCAICPVVLACNRGFEALSDRLVTWMKCDSSGRVVESSHRTRF